MSEVEVNSEEGSSVYDVMSLLDVSHTIEEVQRRFDLAGMSLDAEVRNSTIISSGMLMTDILLNGGIYPGGWYTFFGPEQSAKSTHMMTVMVSLANSQVPLIMYMDAEGSTSEEYIESISESMTGRNDGNMGDIFGIRDPKSEDWIKEPRIRYYAENSLEGIWRSVASTLRRLPDKVHIKDKWWLMFDNTKVNISRFKGQTNTKLSRKHKKVVVPALDEGTPQALILVDSYPSMVSDSQNTDDGDNSLGRDARGHAKFAKEVKGQLKIKHSTVIGVNQLRDALNIGNPYGPKEYEPCGTYLKHCSDARIRQKPLSVPHGKGRLEEEQSAHTKNGVDTYRYVRMNVDKSKFGPPNLEAWYRIWTSDAYGRGRGLCPVYDTWQYLVKTGQGGGTIHKKIWFYLGNKEFPEMQWLDFKKLILLNGKALKKVAERIGLKENPLIRKTCFEQIREGQGLEWFFQTLRGE